MAAKLKSMQDLWQDSYLGSGNEAYLEDLYEAFLQNPDALDSEWQQFFTQLAQRMPNVKPEVSHAAIREQFRQWAREKAHAAVDTGNGSEPLHERQQERVIELITAFRRLGHLQANIDPLGLYKGVYSPNLELAYYGFNESDYDKHFHAGSFTGLNQSSGTLRQIAEALRRIYCGTIGFEYMHINNAEEVEWLRDRIEQGWVNFKPGKEEKLRILDRLIVADGLEKFLGVKYVGQKRFSLEGGDSLIPLLDTLVNNGAEKGIKEMVIGMAHRGRLNVLINVVGKEPKDIFAAFEGLGISETHSGDVKYHLGCSSNVKTPAGPLHLALAFNPSHLEIVSPVVQGSVRARQRRRKDTEQKQVLAIQIHGDAAFAGQGVVMETFSMSQARWFTVGGSIHIVINNQVGFTISNPKDSRSTLYCTDVAKMIETPILHVNGDDPDAVYFAALLAVGYRERFKKDIVIDLVCYRRHGHNEADEPSATQPIMYKIIKNLQPTYVQYAQKCVAEKLIDEAAVKQMVENYRQTIEAGNKVVETLPDESSYEFAVKWQPFVNQDWTAKAKTAVPLTRLKALAKKLEALPAGFVVQAQVKKLLEARQQMTESKLPINWGYGEALAYATLLDEGYPIRLCGQDVARGTFAHRHAVLHDQNTDEIYIPLSHLSEQQAQINIVDSLLSEEGVLAFEYGYASAEPSYLDIWEAQFGDFANGAQVVIDQFISSGEQKWGRLSGLVLSLPHGYEGQGPEHSSARLERYLQLCAQQNMQVCTPTTPAQIFHLLRRQMVRTYRKPLIIMSPKSLLRHPLAVSQLQELAEGEFQVVIPEVEILEPKQVERLVLCAGKVYYDLLKARREKKLNNAAIIRVEQLYPFPEDALVAALAPYRHVRDIIWCQEEPQNQGAWTSVYPELLPLLAKEQKLRYAGRKASASPAAGYYAIHEKEEAALVADALLT